MATSSFLTFLPLRMDISDSFSCTAFIQDVSGKIPFMFVKGKRTRIAVLSSVLVSSSF